MIFFLNTYIFIQENPFANVVWKMSAILSWPQCVKWPMRSQFNCLPATPMMTSSNGKIFHIAGRPFVQEKSPVTGEFPAQRPVTWSFDVFFDLHLNKQLSKQWWGWRRHCAHYDVTVIYLSRSCWPNLSLIPGLNTVTANLHQSIHLPRQVNLTYEPLMLS